MDRYRREHGKRRVEVVREIVRGGGTVRVPIWTLFNWFGHQNRGLHVNAGIGRVLKECGLETHPDFSAESTTPHAILAFRAISSSEGT